ncbi:MAG: cation-transporting P-type ATPase, partial [Ginsengibacter sp.]
MEQTAMADNYSATLVPDLVVKNLRSDADQGLSNKEVLRRTNKFGRNIIGAQVRTNTVIELLRHFKDPLILILISATVISYSL